MARLYNKQSVLDTVNKWEKEGQYQVKTIDNGKQIICYDPNENFKSLIFTDAADGEAFSQRAYNGLPRKYRELFSVNEIACEVIEVSQDILDEVDKEMAEKRKAAKKQGKHLTKQEMILLYNILNRLYDTFDPQEFGCSKRQYKDIITRLDALTE